MNSLNFLLFSIVLSSSGALTATLEKLCHNNESGYVEVLENELPDPSKTCDDCESCSLNACCHSFVFLLSKEMRVQSPVGKKTELIFLTLKFRDPTDDAFRPPIA